MTARSLAPALALLMALGSGALDAGPGERFRARLDLTLVGGPITPSRCELPLVLVELEGVGRATRLGRIVAEASHCILDDPAEEGFQDGILILAGRRGTLELAYSGTDTGGDLDGVFLIVGGTGAFADASGEGTFTGVAVPDEDRATVLFRGRLELP